MSSPSEDVGTLAPMDEEQQAVLKRKRNLPGNPDPYAEVIALSPKTLMATNRFLCEVCGKGFQRDQNLQLHRRGHNLPWKLKQRDGQEIKKRVYVCPGATCVHHDPSRALGDLTGIKKHFSRKHGEKKWKCEKCSKLYAVKADWKAHQKICGTREYRCDCGILFSRRDIFISHRAYCDALAEENVRVSTHRLVESQQTSACTGDALTGAAQEAPSLPPASNADVSKPHRMEVCEHALALKESGVSSSATKRVQGGLAVTTHKSSKGPGLSLCLGTGLGPGPPISTEKLVCPPVSEAIPALKETEKLARLDKRMQWLPYFMSGGVHTSMLNSASNVSDSLDYATGKHGSNGMLGISIGSSGISQFAAPTLDSFASADFLGSGDVYAKHYPQGGQLPATTLLQKAALMGSTTSSSFLFRNLRLGKDSSPSSPGGALHDSWAGAPSTLSRSTWHSFHAETTTELPNSGHESFGAGCPSTFYGGQGSAQRILESSCGVGAARPESASNDVSSSFNITRGFMIDKAGHANSLQDGSRIQDSGACWDEVEGSQRAEKDEGVRTTLDFLGVGAHTRKVGVVTCMRQTLGDSVTH